VSRSAPAALDEFLAAFADDVVEVVHGLRERMLAVTPHAHELVWDAGDGGTTVRVSAGSKRRPGSR
jgi:hypothetical protein